MANRAIACLSLIEKVVVGAIGMVISPRLSKAMESVTPEQVTPGLVIADVPVQQATSQIDAMAIVTRLQYLNPSIRFRCPVCISVLLPLFLVWQSVSAATVLQITPSTAVQYKKI
jgi:hypothetical protein